MRVFFLSAVNGQEVVNLSRGSRYWFFSYHLNHPGIAPDGPHHAFHAVPLANRLEKSFGHFPRIHLAHDRVNQKAQAGAAIGVFLLDQLIMGGFAAKPPGEKFIHDPGDIGVEEGHPANGELLETANMLNMTDPAAGFQGAPASAVRQNGPVTQGNVKQEKWSGGEQSGHQQTPGWATVPILCLYQCQAVAQEMDIIRFLGL
jgi:hypothetical protein